MLCYVYDELCQVNSSDKRIQECVEASLTSFKTLPWLQACLFPVFITAVHAQTEESRSCFESGLMRMHTGLAFQGPLSIALALRNVWEQADASQTRWRETLKGLAVELNILL